MKRIFLMSVCLLALMQIAAPLAYAWNDFGHMSVACIAYKKLLPRTKARVNALLKFNPNYEKWKSEIAQNLSPEEQDTQLFMLAATWPDRIKKDPSYVSDGSGEGNVPEGPQAGQNIGYADHLMHKYWHFCDIPFAQDGTSTMPPVPSPNAETQIGVCRKTLASKAPDELKSYDLVWLMHMVGDVHQPMHCATRVSKFAANGDNGGNDVMVNYDDYQGYRLHGFWDYCLGAGLPPDVMRFAASLPSANKSAAADRNAKDWINESFQITRQKVYASPIRWGNGPFDLSNEYRSAAVALCRERIALAGARLAGVLNKELK